MKLKTTLPLILTFLVFTTVLTADKDPSELKSIALPKVNIKNVSLSEALTKRASTRDFDGSKEISLQDLSNILWAAAGINRPETGGRTYPSARGNQSISVYAARKDGIYLYDHVKHSLEPVVAGDFRAATGSQSFAATAPVNLIYVANISKFDGSNADKKTFAVFDAGHCSENVYLYCAAARIGTVIRASVDAAALGKLLKLDKNNIVIAGQSIGHFAK